MKPAINTASFQISLNETFAVWLASGTVAAISAGIWLVPFLSTRGILLGLVATVLLAPLIYKARRGTFDILDTLVWSNVALLVMFFIRPLALMLTDNYIFRERYNIESTFDRAIVVALVGSLGMQVGYFLPIGSRMGKTCPALPTRLVPTTTLLVAVGFTALAFLARSSAQFSTMQSSSAYVYQLPYLIVPGCMLFTAIGRAYKSPVYTWIAYASIVAFSILTVPKGYRLMLMQVALGFVILVLLRRNWRPRFFSLLASVTVIFFLVTSMRDLQRDYGLKEFLQSVGDHLSDPGASLEIFFTTEDTEMFNGLAMELQIVPAVQHYQPGSAIYLLITHPIPRFIWPEKPRGAEDTLNQQLFGTKLGMAGVAFSILGGFWFDSGYIGVFLGVVAVGIGFRFLREYLLLNQDNDLVRIVYAASLPFVISILRGNLQLLLAIALFTVVPIVVIGSALKSDPRHLRRA